VPNAFVTKDCAVVLATKEGSFPTFTGVAEAMSEPRTDVRILVNQRRVLTGEWLKRLPKDRMLWKEPEQLRRRFQSYKN